MNRWIYHHRKGRVVDLDDNYIGKLERGIIGWPQSDYRSALRAILGTPDDAALGFERPSREPATGTAAVEDLTAELERRNRPSSADEVVDVLRRVHGLRRNTVDPTVVDALRENLDRTLVGYESLDHADVTTRLGKQRALIQVLLDDCRHPAQEKQLYDIAGGTSGLLGYVAVGSGNFPLARAYCLEAFQLSTFAENPGLQAWIRGSQSFCEYYSGDYEAALALATDGLTHARSGPQSVRLAINGVARAAGKLGDAGAVDRAVDAAHRLASLNDVPDGMPSSISFQCYSVAQTAGNAATAYVSLGQPEQARRYLGAAIPEIERSGSPWARMLVNIDLAVSLIRGRDADLDRATRLVGDALERLAPRPVFSVQQRLAHLVTEATLRWGDSKQVGELRDAATITAKHAS